MADGDGDPRRKNNLAKFDKVISSNTYLNMDRFAHGVALITF
jgi:hypothetical protein